MISHLIYFHVQMILAGYLCPAEPRVVLGEEVEKSRLYSSQAFSPSVLKGLGGLSPHLICQVERR